MKSAGAILLVACYELGHQPLAVAWPAAFLERAGYEPAVLDLSVEPLDEEKVRRARAILISVPMHTALRLGTAVLARVRALNPSAHIGLYGLYAALNAEYLRMVPISPWAARRKGRSWSWSPRSTATAPLAPSPPTASGASGSTFPSRAGAPCPRLPNMRNSSGTATDI
jgi:hypothetical protein